MQITTRFYKSQHVFNVNYNTFLNARRLGEHSPSLRILPFINLKISPLIDL